MRYGKQSFTFEEVYIQEGATVIGPKEAQGAMKPYVDKIFDSLLLDKTSFEASERRLQIEAINILKNKALFLERDIDVCFSGDLINQQTISSYAMREFDIPFINIYAACATYALGLINAAVYLDGGNAKKIITVTSSHLLAAERTLRNPIEYGGAKDEKTTHTVTGCSAVLVGKKKTKIKITKATLGKVCDVDFHSSVNMGAAMAPSAIETLMAHFDDFKTTSEDYDLILTGDLSQIGRSIVFDAMHNNYGSFKNYDDCGLMIYRYFEQQVFSGGSGCACCGVVTTSYIFEKLKAGELKKVLICATGALMNQTTNLQKEGVASISHAIVLERVEE